MKRPTTKTIIANNTRIRETALSQVFLSISTKSAKIATNINMTADSITFVDFIFPPLIPNFNFIILENYEQSNRRGEPLERGVENTAGTRKAKTGLTQRREHLKRCSRLMFSEISKSQIRYCDKDIHMNWIINIKKVFHSPTLCPIIQKHKRNC